MVQKSHQLDLEQWVYHHFKVLDRAIELGSTYIDSADIYEDNEELIGKYFQKISTTTSKGYFTFFLTKN
jgi:aryl-alcohol dehydrogenase-like predicted oxidoreductase